MIIGYGRGNCGGVTFYTMIIIMHEMPDTRSQLPITGSLTKVKAVQPSQHSSVGRASVLSHALRQQHI